ncbi:MAG: beta-galactosidase GalA [Bacteroidota bacterium]
MKKSIAVVLAILIAHSIVVGQPTKTIREKLLMDFAWRFQLGDAASVEGDFGYGKGALFAKAGQPTGPLEPSFNDSLWRPVDLPHDWVAELDFVNSNDEDVKYHGFKPVGRMFPRNSIGWYRRSFLLPKSDENRRIVLQFDGVFRDCAVWLNGHLLGRNLSGYSGFSFDATDYLRFGEKNVLAVRVDATQYEGWFYEGAGIYRHVWLIKYGAIHIPEGGVFVYSTISEKNATVTVETEVANQGDKEEAVQVESVLLDRSGKQQWRVSSRALKTGSWKNSNVKQTFNLANPHLWDLEDPYCYTVISKVRVGNKIVDSTATTLGIRDVRFDLKKGFLLNGRVVKIQGVCCHQDHAGVGSALPDRLQYFRIEKLKEMGCNAYRSSHNPPTPELLEACDRLGMLVLDENRLLGSSPEFMSQFEHLVRRDRNHPSVFLWSLGNEEWGIQNSETGKRIAISLLRKLKELDPTRLATYAANNGNHFEGINSVIPVRGFNYMNIMDIDKYRKDHPSQFVIGSEEASTVCTRGIYANDTIRGYVSDYDVNKPSWGSIAEQWWKFYAGREWLPGAFVWTGFDYRGESTPYGWPCINSHFGIMDVCGFPKNNYYYYQSWWTDKTVLHLVPPWNWKGYEGSPLAVWCQSNCDKVELFLNGKSLGEKKMERNSHLEWSVPYEAGVLEAHGWRNGKEIVNRIETTGEPRTLQLVADRATINGDGEDVSVVTVSCKDTQGRDVPDAMNLVRFELSGPGKIIGVGNGDPSSHERDKDVNGLYRRSMFNGLAQVLVQATKQSGTLTLRGFADGLEAGTVIIKISSVEPRPAIE